MIPADVARLEMSSAWYCSSQQRGIKGFLVWRELKHKVNGDTDLRPVLRDEEVIKASRDENVVTANQRVGY